MNGNVLKLCLHPNLVCEDKVLAENINQAFINIMKDYSPLTDSVQVALEDDEPLSVTELCVTINSVVNSFRAGGPDDLSNWMLREFADILAEPVTDILAYGNSRHNTDYNKDLRPKPISLTSTLSKIAEGFVIEKSLKPVVLSSLDPRQYGFILRSSTTFALTTGYVLVMVLVQPYKHRTSRLLESF